MLRRWRVAHQMWRSYIDKSAYAWKSKVFVPVTFNVCEQATARYSIALGATDPLVRISARHPQSVAAAAKVEAWMEVQAREAKLRSEIGRFIKQAVIYGTGLIKHRWRHERAPSGEVLYDGPVSEVHPLSRFWADPHATDLDHAGWCISTQRRTMAHIEQLAKDGVYRKSAIRKLEQHLGDWRQRQTTSPPTEVTQLTAAQRAAGGLPADGDTWPDPEPGIEILVFYEPGRLVVLAGDIVLRDTRDQEFPFDLVKFPFQKWCFVEELNSFYGIGAPEAIRDLQHEKNSIRNHRMDGLRLSMDPMWLVNRHSALRLQDLRYGTRPGEIVRSDSLHDSIRPLDVRPPSQEAYLEEQMVDRAIQDVLGFGDQLRGIQTRSRTTAAEVRALSLAANDLIEMNLMRLEEDLVSPLAKSWVHMAAQINDETVYVPSREAPDRFVEIDPTDLRGRFAFHATGTSSTINSTERDSYVNAFTQILLQPEVAQAAGVNVKEAVVVLMEQLGLRRHAARIMSNPDSTGQGGLGGPQAPDGIPPELMALLGQAGQGAPPPAPVGGSAQPLRFLPLPQAGR